jgi:hypothetical protein
MKGDALCGTGQFATAHGIARADKRDVPIDVPVANVGHAQAGSRLTEQLETGEQRMSPTDVMTLPEREAHQQPAAVPRRHICKITIGSIITTVMLSIYATLLGPPGALQGRERRSQRRLATAPSRTTSPPGRVGGRTPHVEGPHRERGALRHRAR